MKKTIVILLVLFGLSESQSVQNNKIKPTGTPIGTTTVPFDFSSCDVVEVSMPIHKLQVDSGVVRAYWFKKYNSELVVTCQVTTTTKK